MPYGGKKRRELLYRGLFNQDYKCYWCRLSFGEVVIRDNKMVVLTPEFEHVIPQSYRRSDKLENLVLSCQICNRLKRNYVSENEDDIRRYIIEKWEKRKVVIAPSYKSGFKPTTLKEAM